ncbi:asparaginase [Nonlabens ponticola]|uniref:asparaginase n=1 Tax=Nonlabens ponticola TaxID=2496866 RepID=A0A3S9MWA8_9FLAO|nr:asparaginase [Nonlabens ponticola]AZQ43424.1 asparaginase [Nonlabens ponticola]
MKPRILLIYTGGTIGMIKDPETQALKSFNFDELLLHIPEIKLLDCEISTTSFKQPIDSSDMNIHHWRHIGDVIHDAYDDYEGFVVLHGSDTMSYTGSALSFMFENLTKPIIFTGSQLPIGDLRTDAKENLITSLQLAIQQERGKPVIQEVCIYFEYQLYRANRTVKANAEHFEAFKSPNYPPLAISGVMLNIDKSLLWQGDYDYLAFAKADKPKTPKQKERMFYRPEFVDKVVVLKIFPGITQAVVSAICNIEGIKGIILESYGSGNAPTEDWFLNTIVSAIKKGIKVVNVTQCHGGSVMMGKYETSVQLLSMGVISGKDITTEAALAKMMYLLNYATDKETFSSYFTKSLRGELTE